MLVAALPPSRDNKPTFTLLDIPAGLTDGLDVGGYEVPDAFGPAPIGFEWGGLFKGSMNRPAHTQFCSGSVLNFCLVLL